VGRGEGDVEGEVRGHTKLFSGPVRRLFRAAVVHSGLVGDGQTTALQGWLGGQGLAGNEVC
jgi:hypothetical protein